MHSFTAAALVVMVVLDGRRVEGRVLREAKPTITPAPRMDQLVNVQRDDPDAVSLGEVLLTAVPEWLREIAATNIPAVSSFIKEEFSYGSRPEWFNDLPWDIQSYLIQEFGPATAVPNPTGPEYSESAGGASSQPAETGANPASTANPSPSSPEQTHSPTGTSQPSGASSSSPDSTQTLGSSQSGSASSGSTWATSIRATSMISSKIPIAAPTASPSSPSAPSADQTNHSGLTKQQKIGIGIGVPFGIAGAAAIALACCFLLRRRRRKNVDGSVPPSSPGFIPRFAFQEKQAHDTEQHRPLNRVSDNSFGDLANMTWDDDVMDYSSSSGEEVPTLHNQPQPVMAPVLYHTHSSNRARGKRTSYTSLHSVAEVTEPDDEAESPVLPRQTPPQIGAMRHSPNRQSPPRNLVPSPTVPSASKIKRKPVPSNYSPTPAAQLASQSLLRQTMPDQPSSSHPPPRFGNHTKITSNNSHSSPYVSPIEDRRPSNPFSNAYHYEEDYGPEYYNTHHNNNSYVDIEDGIHGGHTDLSRYPTLERPRKNSKTDWPLRNISNHRRNKSPLWDRVYDG